MRRLNDDQGAVSVFIGIAIAVLLGFAGLAIDVGAMYHERRQLQNGADAAALAIAEACARNEVGCTPSTALPIARSYAEANANDGFADIADVTIDLDAKRVTVHTRTLTPDGSNTMAPFFAGVLGFGGSTVEAVAVAEWGHPSALFNFLPLAISMCEFENVHSIPSDSMVITFHQGNNQNMCRAQAGLDAYGDEFMPGGFGWLETPSNACKTYLEAGTWVSVDTGSSPTTGCSPSYLLSLTAKPIPLPVFDGIRSQGTKGEFHLHGFAYFQITGFNFGGQFKLGTPCDGSTRCLEGHFTTGVIFDGDLGGADLGISIVKLVG